MVETDADPTRLSLEDQLTAMAHQLTDLTRRNLALYYPKTRNQGLDLNKANSKALDALLNGGILSVAELFPKTRQEHFALNLGGDDETGIAESVEGDPKALKVAKAHHRFSQLVREEKGIETYWFASFVVAWIHDGKDYRSPIFFTRATIETIGSAGGFTISIGRRDETLINPSLVSYMKMMYDIELAAVLAPDAVTSEGDGLQVAFDERAAAAEGIKASISRVIDVDLDIEFKVFDNFNFSRLPIIGDLTSDEFFGVVRENPVILSMLGIDSSRLDADLTSLVEVDSLDREPPAQLPVVADVNASQLVAIRTVLNGSHLVIQGPPGTGKSQTIANLIGLLAAEGKKVLFVADKEAAISAVAEILDSNDLGHLLLPLHGESSRYKALARIQQNWNRAQSIEPTSFSFERLEEIHADLLERQELSRSIVSPSSSTVIDLIGKWAAIPEHFDDGGLDASSSGWRDAVADDFKGVKDLARLMAVSGYLDTSANNSPWVGLSVDESLTVDDCQRLLSTCMYEALTPPARRWLDPFATQPLLDAADHFGVLLNFARAEQSITKDLSDLEVFAYANSFNLGSIGTKTFKRTGSAASALRDRRAFKRLLAQPNGHAETAVKTLVHARLAIQDIATARPTRAEFESISEIGGFLAKLVDLTRSLSIDENLTVDRVVSVASGCLRDLDFFPRAKLWSQIRRTQAELSLGDDLLGLFASGNSQSASQGLMEGILAGRLVRDLLRGGSRLGIVDPKELVRAFVEEDERAFSLGPTRVAVEASSRLEAYQTQGTPDGQQPKELKHLRDQFGKRRGAPSIRRLFELDPGAILAINPCVALSPVQVSSYLPRRKLFDVVIFDEASQLTPIEAIPSIARGELVVVAGDKHQLPPSEFFETSAVIEDLEITDSDSILTVLEPLLPNQWLNVHYRSNDARLIAVSAEHVYWALSRLRLRTAPSASAREDCIRFIEVEDDTITMQGTIPSSDLEVQAVVREVFHHIDTYPNRSLGVITLSREHCDRVELAIERAKSERRDLEWYFAQPGKRKFFVKNIERVQGDERDAIIISTGYQRNASGQLPQNFGPIAKRDGGYRRVNVMISRAKMSMMLVASFNSGDIRISDASGYGVRLLHTFFQFMETGGQVLANAPRVEQPMNPFELSIYEAIRARGIEVVPQLGVSGYWIDFALLHPDRPGTYVLAVEADGAMYHSTATARERDRMRQAHLEAKGFRFHRVWSTDWFRNRRVEVDRIVDAFNLAVLLADQSASRNVERPLPHITKGPDSQRIPLIPRELIAIEIEEVPESELDAVVLQARVLNPGSTDAQLILNVAEAFGWSASDSRIREALELPLRRTSASNASDPSPSGGNSWTLFNQQTLHDAGGDEWRTPAL